ncbi:glycosyltransferase family 2 protein (plasmid) [Shinella sumterensis]|nr:glycosyltransferase family 2 protein [Shinella sumterensis]
MTAAVSILLATYQGERFLPEQLSTIEEQSHSAWSLHASDDGSTDRTRTILAEFAQKSKREVNLVEGPRKGFVRNFMHLVATVPTDAPYFAFCDQDDKWLPEKLKRAVRWLGSQPAELPLLFCSRTRNIDLVGRPIGFSPLFQRGPSFGNALVQSIAGGNTMVINRRMLNLIKEFGTHHELPSHDWWFYIIATGVGGIVNYDPSPTVDYRQHEQNQVGANSSLNARLRRFTMLKGGRFKRWTDLNTLALEENRHLLLPQNNEILTHFQKMRTSSFPSNLRVLLNGPFRRQTFLGSIGLSAAVVWNKI